MTLESTTVFYLWQTSGKEILQGSLNNVWESATMVNAFKFQVKPYIMKTNKYSFAIDFTACVRNKNIQKKIFNFGTVVFVINNDIKKSF